MNQTQLIYPTLDLFLYDLAQGIGQSESEINQKRERFWRRIYRDDLNEKKLTEFQAREDALSSYIELLDTQRIERFKHPLDGFYYPVKLGDTYALQIDYSGKINDSEWDNLTEAEKLQNIKQTVLEHSQILPGEMGESWLFWAKVANQNHTPETLETLAEECYKNLEIFPKPNWKRDKKGQGTFKGITVFQIEKPDSTADGYNRNNFLLICLFPCEQNDAEIKATIGKLYRELIPLFQYRNKILWVYEQSRQLKDTLKQAAQTVQANFNVLSLQLTTSQLNLHNLQQNLIDNWSISHNYEASLTYLQEHALNLEINLKNYQKRVQSIAKQDANSDLSFLETFGDFAREKYLNQINTDYQLLSAGSKLLENSIKSITGITEIERTKNERIFNQTIAIASVGISTASLAATTITNQAEGIIKTILPVPASQPTPAVNLWASFGLSFLLSVGIGLFSAGLTWLFLNKRK
jgi:hypothetical protein